MRQIRLALNETGRVRVVRNSVGFDPQARVRYGLGVGSADLVGLLRASGRVFAVEVKTATGRLSPDQRRWLQALRSLGGFACVARSVPDALAALDRAEQGASE